MPYIIASVNQYLLKKGSTFDGEVFKVDFGSRFLEQTLKQLPDNCERRCLLEIQDEDDILKYGHTYVVMFIGRLEDFRKCKLYKKAEIICSGDSYDGRYVVLKFKSVMTWEDLGNSSRWDIPFKYMNHLVKYSIESLIESCTQIGEQGVIAGKELATELNRYHRDLKLESIVS